MRKKPSVSLKERIYRRKLEKLEIPAGMFWNERYIVALWTQGLYLDADPHEPYHIMAPMPVLGDVITWDKAYIMEI